MEVIPRGVNHHNQLLGFYTIKTKVMNNLKEDQAYRQARRRVKEIKSFYYHLTCYCVIIPIIIACNLIFMPEYYWFPFSMFGWGFGVFFHGMEVFKYNPFFSEEWKERKMKQFLDEDREQELKFKK